MALDERDRNFEKALAKQLRHSAEPEESANLGSSGVAACPDAEILAAYHERTLETEELISWKTHIAGCGQCQELLSQLELTDSIAMKSETVGVQHAAPLLGTIATETAAPAQRAKIQTFPTSHRPKLRWIAPAGAIAAGLLVWMVARENQPLPQPENRQIQIAQNEPATAAPVPSATVPMAPEEANRSEAKRDEPRPALIVPSASPKEKDSFEKENPIADLPVEGRSRRDLQLSQQTGAVVGGAASATQNSAALDAASGARALPKPEIAQNGGLPQNAGVQSDKQQISAKALAPPPPPQNQLPPSPPAGKPSQSADAITEAGQNQVVVSAETREYSQLQALKKVSRGATRDSRVALASGGSIVWHVGLSGGIEKSVDGGRTFTRQESGVQMELLAASAPSDSVCWAVGRSGTILLTVDGGAHWNKLTSPIQANLGSIKAADAMHATISDVANRASFATIDGGTTWNRISSE